MIRGMTGQASLRFSHNMFDAEMEIRSVNSRYFEFRAKLPARFSQFEMEARKIVSAKLQRGKIDLSLRITEKDNTESTTLINIEAAKSYLRETKKMCEELEIPFSITAREILSLPHVLNCENAEVGEDVILFLGSKLQELIDLMLPMMLVEASNTIEDVKASLNSIETALIVIRERYPQALARYKEALIQRVAEITQTRPPEERLSVEVEIFAGRTAINEEIIRLQSHIGMMKDILIQKKHGGSKELDFIAQEMNRETNTIAAKSSDFGITEQTIFIKSEIEKMREHFRNIV